MKKNNEKKPDHQGWENHFKKLQRRANGRPISFKKLEELSVLYNCPKPIMINGKISFKKENDHNKWWDSLSFEDKFYKVIEWLEMQGRNITDIHPNDITDQYIKEIHRVLEKKEEVY